MARKTKEVKNTVKEGAATITIRDCYNDLGENREFLDFAFEESKTQRETKADTKGTQDFFASMVFCAINSEDLSDELTDKINAKYVLSDKAFTELCVQINPEEKWHTILNGLHRIARIRKILENKVALQTNEEARKDKTYKSALKEVYENYGGKTYKELPLPIRKRIDALKIRLNIYETNIQDIAALIFDNTNSYRTISKNDRINNIFWDNEMWLNVKLSAQSLKNSKWTDMIKFKGTYYKNPLTEKQYITLKTKMSQGKKGISEDANINFFLRNLTALNPEIKWVDKANDLSFNALYFYSTANKTRTKRDFNLMINMLCNLHECLPFIKYNLYSVYTGFMMFLDEVTCFAKTKEEKKKIIENIFKIVKNNNEEIKKSIQTRLKSLVPSSSETWENYFESTAQQSAKPEAAKEIFEQLIYNEFVDISKTSKNTLTI